MTRRNIFVAQAVALTALLAFSTIGLRAEPVDCKRAAAVDELAICASPDLQIMDDELDRAYRAARVRWTDSMSKSVRVMQEEWVKQRRQCGADRNCLMARIVEQIQVLDKMRPESPTWILELNKSKPMQ